MLARLRHLASDSLLAFAKPRSSRWPAVRSAHLAANPRCMACEPDAAPRRVDVHHKLPYHLFPEVELDPSNLITLCEDREHHLHIGHGGNFHSYNPNVVSDATDVRAHLAAIAAIVTRARETRRDE